MTPDNDSSNHKSQTILIINTWFRIILISAITGVILYKIFFSPINLSSFDFSDLLSLILGIFSIGLSVMFYFKANEISNQFYDNTYKFTQNVSNILGRIEAGFGERLKHLDEGYNGIREAIYKSPTNDKVIEKNIETSEKELEKVLQERDKIIEELLVRAKVVDDEKTSITKALKDKDLELQKTQDELSNLRKKISLDNSPTVIARKKTAIKEYFLAFETHRHFFSMIYESDDKFREQFHNLSKAIDQGWILDCHKIGYLDDSTNLTNDGLEFFKNILYGNI